MSRHIIPRQHIPARQTTMRCLVSHYRPDRTLAIARCIGFLAGLGLAIIAFAIFLYTK